MAKANAFFVYSATGGFGSQIHPKPLPNKETGKSWHCNHMRNGYPWMYVVSTCVNDPCLGLVFDYHFFLPTNDQQLIQR